MTSRKGILSGRGLLRLLCALSLLLVAFAHRPLSIARAGPAYAPAELAAFVLPDGTLPDLCIGGDDDPRHYAANHCEACRIVTAVDLPVPFPGFEITRWFATAELAVPQDATLAHPALRPGASPRGPPVLTV